MAKKVEIKDNAAKAMPFMRNTGPAIKKRSHNLASHGILQGRKKCKQTTVVLHNNRHEIKTELVGSGGSLAAAAAPVGITRINPIFLWVKQDDSHIIEVKCEDYDKRNRIRLTKTANGGWLAKPRTTTEAIAETLKKKKKKKRRKKKHRKAEKELENIRIATATNHDGENHELSSAATISTSSNNQIIQNNDETFTTATTTTRDFPIESSKDCNEKIVINELKFLLKTKELVVPIKQQIVEEDATIEEDEEDAVVGVETEADEEIEEPAEEREEQEESMKVDEIVRDVNISAEVGDVNLPIEAMPTKIECIKEEMVETINVSSEDESNFHDDDDGDVGIPCNDDGRDEGPVASASKPIIDDIIIPSRVESPELVQSVATVNDEIESIDDVFLQDNLTNVSVPTSTHSVENLALAINDLLELDKYAEQIASLAAAQANDVLLPNTPDLLDDIGTSFIESPPFKLHDNSLDVTMTPRSNNPSKLCSKYKQFSVRKSISPASSCYFQSPDRISVELSPPKRNSSRTSNPSPKHASAGKIPWSKLRNSDIDACPLTQLRLLIRNPEWNVPDPLLVPKDRLNAILASPAREIPLLLTTRPELRLPKTFEYPNILQDPNIIVVSLAQLEIILIKQNNLLKTIPQQKTNIIAKDKTNSRSKYNREHLGKILSSPSPTATQCNVAGSTGTGNGAVGNVEAAFNHMMWVPNLSQTYKNVIAPTQSKRVGMLPILINSDDILEFPGQYQNGQFNNAAVDDMTKWSASQNQEYRNDDFLQARKFNQKCKDQFDNNMSGNQLHHQQNPIVPPKDLRQMLQQQQQQPTMPSYNDSDFCDDISQNWMSSLQQHTPQNPYQQMQQQYYQHYLNQAAAAAALSMPHHNPFAYLPAVLNKQKMAVAAAAEQQQTQQQRCYQEKPRVSCKAIADLMDPNIVERSMNVATAVQAPVAHSNELNNNHVPNSGRYHHDAAVKVKVKTDRSQQPQQQHYLNPVAAMRQNVIKEDIASPTPELQEVINYGNMAMWHPWFANKLQNGNCSGLWD